MEQQAEIQERSIVLTSKNEQNLLTTAKWIEFIAVACTIFLFLGLTIAVACVYGLGLFSNLRGITVIAVVYLSFYALLVACVYNMFLFSILTKKAITNRDSSALDAAMSHKRLFWKHLSLFFIAVLTIVVALIVLAFCSGLVGSIVDAIADLWKHIIRNVVAGAD